MPKAERDAGDAQLQRIFAVLNAQLVSPGGAAALEARGSMTWRRRSRI
jgi:hypothetical protein